MLSSLYGYDVFHFSNAHGIAFGWRIQSAVAQRLGIHAEIHSSRRSARRSCTRNNGCLDGVSQTAFSKWGPESVCSICRWQHEPLSAVTSATWPGGSSETRWPIINVRWVATVLISMTIRECTKSRVLLPRSRTLASGNRDSRAVSPAARFLKVLCVFITRSDIVTSEPAAMGSISSPPTSIFP
jgi:hypothetical protein